MPKLLIRQKNDIFQMTSGRFLTEGFPDEFLEWDENEVFDWINDHVREPMEGMSADEIWDVIEAAALVTIKHIEDL